MSETGASLEADLTTCMRTDHMFATAKLLLDYAIVAVLPGHQWIIYEQIIQLYPQCCNMHDNNTHLAGPAEPV